MTVFENLRASFRAFERMLVRFIVFECFLDPMRVFSSVCERTEALLRSFDIYCAF